ncbi:reverse transcriptase domain-containing protein [Tanacetum coccineum]
MVEALLLDKKNQSQTPAHQTLASVKAVEESCVTCGGARSYQSCSATDGNVYHDNIQTYVSQAAAANFNQGNTSTRPPMVAKPNSTDFDSYVKANDAVMRNMKNQNQVLQNQGQNLQTQLNNLATSNQRLESMLGNFIKMNTASTSGSGTLPGNTIANPKEDLKGITTRSGVAYQGPAIPSTSSSLPKVMNHDTEVTKDTMLPTNNGSTEDVQPPVVQVQSQNPTSKPVVDPVSAPRPNQQTSIPFPSRRNDERRREKANDQIEKFYEIFRDLSFKISFTDALTLMPKFASTLKTLIGNKEKLSEMARTPLNENCSAVILNKLPKKLGDPGRFLIPCEFSGINTCNALADLGASINLMPYSVWKDLSLPELTPTCMTLELADRSITEPIGIAKDVRLMVGKFQFLADFVVVDFEPDPRVPLILGRSFLKTSRALIDVYEGEITLRVGKEAITFNLDQTSRYTANYNHMTANRIDVIELACEEYSQEVLGFSDSVAYGNPSPDYDPIVSNSSPTLTPFGDSDFLLLEEANAFIAINDEPISREIDATYYDPEELKVVEAKTVKSSIDEPPEVELKDLPPHLGIRHFLGRRRLIARPMAERLKDEKGSFFIKVLSPTSEPSLGNSPISRVLIQSFVLTKSLWLRKRMNEDERGQRNHQSESKTIPIDPKDQEKTTFTCPYRTFAYRRMPFGLCNAPGTFQRCMMAIFHDMIEKTMEVFMDDFSVFGDSFSTCLSHLEKMLKRCEDTNLSLNWEKSHFMVKEGIVLGHKISKSGIEVDRAKVEVIAKLPHPTTMKDLEIPHQNEFENKDKSPETFPSKTLGSVALHNDSNPMVAGGKKLLTFSKLATVEPEGTLRLKIFSGKLKTRWSGPFTVTQVFPYGTIELSQNSGPNFKVNGHRLKHYFGGDVPTEDCPDYEDSRAPSFVFHSQEFHILSFILGIQDLGDFPGVVISHQKRSTTNLEIEGEKIVFESPHTTAHLVLFSIQKKHRRKRSKEEKKLGYK